jgi:hypothetical protein
MSWSGLRTAGTGCATSPVGVAGGGRFGLGDLEKCGQGLGFVVDIGANDAVVDAGPHADEAPASMAWVDAAGPLHAR